MRRFLLLLLVFCLPATALAQTYRWVDESGQVHYSQSPPPKGVAGTYVRPAHPPSSAPNQDALNKSLKQEQLDAPAKKAAADQAAAEQASRAADCARTTDDLATLESQTANRMRTTEEEHQARRKELQDFLAQHCR